MLPQARFAILSGLTALWVMMADSPSVAAASRLPDKDRAGIAERLYRIDCGRSLANDESVWTPGENVGMSIQFSSTCWLMKHGPDWLLVGHGRT
jgi:N-acyl homoserine lactone hydrolase